MVLAGSFPEAKEGHKLRTRIREMKKQVCTFNWFLNISFFLLFVRGNFAYWLIKDLSLATLPG